MRTVGLVVGVLVLMALTLAPAIAAQPFSNVPQDHWAYNAIDKLASQGLIEGYPDGAFKGKRTMTRYEFAVAVARLLENVQAIAKQPGPAGPMGPAGPAGPAGEAGCLTAEQQALLNRLATEFAPELQALRSDLQKLTSQVEALQNKPNACAPVVTINGNIGWRTEVYGTKLGFEDVNSTGYPAFGYGGEGAGYAFGVIPVEFDELAGKNKEWFNILGIPISDALKDSFKAADSMEMRTRLSATANLGPDTCAFLQLLAGPTTNMFYANPGHARTGSILRTSSAATV